MQDMIKKNEKEHIMRKVIKKIAASALVILLMCGLWGQTIQATQEQIDGVKENIDDLEEKQKEAQKKKQRRYER